jgi:hypothetical protein
MSLTSVVVGCDFRRGERVSLVDSHISDRPRHVVLISIRVVKVPNRDLARTEEGERGGGGITGSITGSVAVQTTSSGDSVGLNQEQREQTISTIPSHATTNQHVMASLNN